MRQKCSGLLVPEKYMGSYTYQHKKELIDFSNLIISNSNHKHFL